MWNNDGGFMGSKNQGESGFMNSPSQVSSPAAAKERRSDHPVPVTIKSIKESQSDSVDVAGTEVKAVVVVGIIKSVDIASTKITFTIDDTTGIIQAFKWIDTEVEDDIQHASFEKSYCKIFGTLRTQQEVKHIMIYNIRQITDMNFLTTHLLEVIYYKKKLQEIANRSTDGSNPSGLTGVSTSAVGATDDASNMQGLTGPAKLVYQLVKMSKEDVGSNKTYIQEALAGKVTPATIDNILDHLSNEGLIFCTIDDEHFKTSDNY